MNWKGKLWAEHTEGVPVPAGRASNEIVAIPRPSKQLSDATLRD